MGVVVNRALPLILQGAVCSTSSILSQFQSVHGQTLQPRTPESFSLEFGIMQTIHDGFCSFFGLSSMITMSAIRGQRSPLLLCSFPWLQTWGKKEKLRQQLGSGVFSNLRESLCLDNIFLKTSISKPGKYLIALVKQLGRAPFTQTWFQTHDAGKLCGFQMKHSPW